MSEQRVVFKEAALSLRMNHSVYLRARFSRAVQSFGYLATLSGLLLLSGWLLWGAFGMLFVLALTATAILAGGGLPVPVLMKMRGARPLGRGEARWLSLLTARLATRAGLESPPALYVVPGGGLQAFAVGSGSEAGIAVTAGLVHALNSEELEGVLAHEISHLSSGDTKLMGTAVAIRSLTRSLATLAWFLLLFSVLSAGAFQVSLSGTLILMLAPALSYLAELGLSRAREFSADLAAAQLTQRPEALARALAKLQWEHTSMWANLFGHDALAYLPEALRTHPSTRERIRRLLELRVPAKHGCSGYSPAARNTRWSVAMM